MQNDIEQQLNQLDSQAVQLYMQAQYKQAIGLAVQSLDLARRILGEIHPRFANSLHNLAQLHRATGNYKVAEELFCQLLEIRRRTLGEQHPDFASSLNEVAALHYSLGNYAAAEPLLRQALQIRRSVLGEQDPNFAQSLNNLAELYRTTNKYVAAEPLYKQAMDIWSKTLGAQDPSFAIGLNNLALLYHSAGKYAAAETLLQQALKIRRNTLGEQHPDFGQSLNNLAALYCEMGNYTAAEALFRQALEIRRKTVGEQHPDFAINLSHLARLYKQMGNYTAAERLYSKSLEIYRNALGDQHKDFAVILNDLGQLYTARGNYEAAEQMYRQALEVQGKALGEQHPDFVSSLVSLADLYITMGNYAAAEPLLRQASEALRNSVGERQPDFRALFAELTVLYVATQRQDEALLLTQQADAIDDYMIGQVFSVGSENQRATYAKSIQTHLAAHLSLVLHYFSETASAVRAALDLVLRRKAIGLEALLVQRAAVLGGKYPVLQPRLSELTTLRMQVAQKILSGPGAEGIEVHQKQLAEWNARKERLEADLARQIPEMNVERRLRTAEHQAVALALPEGVALVEFVRFGVFDFEAVPGRGESRWKPARYIAFVLKAGEPDNVHIIDLGEAEVIDQMIATFRAGITGEAESRGSQDVQARPTQAPKVSQALGLRAAVFDPLLAALGGRKRLLLAVDGDLSRLPFEVLPTMDGGRLIDAYHISYLGAGRDVLRFRAAKSGRPSEALVVADPDFDLGGKAISAGPSGRADGDPSAPNSKAGLWFRLSNKERLLPASQASPSAQPARAAAQVGRQSRDLDPDKLHFEPLPGTRVEGEHIGEMLGVRPWVGRAALDAPLKACKSPRILHLATHGFFLPDQKWDPNKDQLGLGAFGQAVGGQPTRMSGPGLENPLLRSGLLLAGFNTWIRGGSLPPEAEDGILTAEDVSGLDLLDTDLVVLSACDTGLGEVRTGEGVYGLRRAFVLAGTKGLVMSLWKVPDEETRELMEGFYQGILKERPKLSRAEALREAQLAMKERDEYRDPLYWGAFIYEGDPS